MPLGLFKKLGKYPWTGGLGAELPAGSRGSALVGVQGGKLELFLNQNCPKSHQLTRMVVTHTIHARGGGGGGGGKEEKKKLEGLKKSEFREKKVGKTASLIAPSSGYISLNFNMPFKLLQMRSEVVF